MRYICTSIVATLVLAGTSLGDTLPGWTIKAIGDFNGDGQSDILWMGDYGVDGAGAYEGSLISWINWDGTDEGYESNFVYNGVATGAPVPEDWVVAGTGDMNTDGRDDIVWRTPDDSVCVWLMEPNGHDYNSQWFYSGTMGGWTIKAIGDFNGDDQDDVLFQCTDADNIYYTSLLAWINWDGTDGGYTSVVLWNSDAKGVDIPASWQIQGSGNCDGDGPDDIVWRLSDGSVCVWLMEPNGQSYNSQWFYSGIFTGWTIKAIGDFNGDGQSDILWMGDYGVDGAGAYEGSLISWINWDGTDEGYESNFVYNGVATGAPVPEDWVVAGTGDMNTDGRDDIVWRTPDGSVLVWLMEPNGHDYNSQWLASGDTDGNWTVDDDGPADFDNIQAAVDAASDGDEIVVAPGTYTGTGNQVVDMLGKALWLHSSDGPEVTIINGEGARRGITCSSSESSETAIEGFTIANGRRDGSGANGVGGGVYCFFSSPTLRFCTIINNKANEGGGLYLNQSSPLIANCKIQSNENIVAHGSGIRCANYSSPLITDSEFLSNTSEYAIHNDHSSPMILRCMFIENTRTVACIASPNTAIGECCFGKMFTMVPVASIWAEIPLAFHVIKAQILMATVSQTTSTTALSTILIRKIATAMASATSATLIPDSVRI